MCKIKKSNFLAIFVAVIVLLMASVINSEAATNNSYANATTISIGNMVSGTNASYSEWYKAYVRSGAEIYISGSSQVSKKFHICDASGTSVLSVNNGDTSKQRFYIESGWVYFKVVGNSGAYVFSTGFSSELSTYPETESSKYDTFNNAKKIEIDNNVSGLLPYYYRFMEDEVDMYYFDSEIDGIMNFNVYAYSDAYLYEYASKSENTTFNIYNSKKELISTNNIPNKVEAFNIKLNINKGERYYIELKGRNIAYSINRTITGCQLEKNTYFYDGSDKCPEVSIEGLEQGVDYTVEYTNNTDVGIATAIINGLGEDGFHIESNYYIVDKNSIELKETEYTYDGTEKKPVIEIDGTSSNDLEVSYDSNIEAGKGKVIVNEKGDDENRVVLEFTIKKLDVSTLNITIPEEYYSYTGGEIKPEITLKNLVVDRDYTLHYEDNINVGKAYVVITGIDSCDGVLRIPFLIRRELANTDFNLSETSYIYNGDEIKPNIVSDLTEGIDCLCEYSNNINAGTAKVRIAGKGNYYGTIELEYTINPKSIEGMDVNLEQDVYTYDTTAHEPTVSIDGLKLGTDYTIAYSNNTNAGIATITITGKGNYIGDIERTFEIKKCKISGMIATLSQDEYVYDGSAKEPGVSVEGLEQGKDFTVSYSDNINIGTAIATITGTGNYKGEITKKYKIGRDISILTANLSKDTYTYDGTAKEPGVSVEGLEQGKDFTVSYSDNINAGTATVTIKSAGEYVGKITKTFTISKYNYANEGATSGDITLPVKSKLYFGSYPQREVVGEASQSGVYGKTWGTTSSTTNDCYIVDSELYTTLKNLSDDKWDSNGDTTVDGTKYRRIKESNATYSTSGSSGYYNWSDSTSYHYFKYEPIKWRVLKSTEDDAFLLCDTAIVDQQYNLSYTSITWEKSTIRSFLNSYDGSSSSYGKNYSGAGFYDIAFNATEKGAIKTTEVVNDNNKYYKTDGGNDTQDKVFLLSEDEVYGSQATDYGFANDVGKDTARQIKSSTYAKAMGTYASTNSSYLGTCYWWLRSPGQSTRGAVYVSDGGGVYRSGDYVQGGGCSYGLLPALHINLKSINPTWTEKSIDDITLSFDTAWYTGEELTPSVTIDGLTEDEDFEVRYEDNIEVGTAKAIVTGKGDWSGTITKTFEIIDVDTIQLSESSYTYDGETKKPGVVVKGIGEDTTLDPATDYDVEYINNVDAGISTARIKFKGNYDGILEKNFTINPQKLSNRTVKLSPTFCTCEIEESERETKEPTVTIEGLAEDTDYTVEYSDNINPGTARVTIKGKGNYTGEIVETFRIGFKLSGTVELSQTSYIYDGTEKRPTATLAGYTEGTDFEVSYSNNTEVGTATVTIEGIGNYVGELTASFTIEKVNLKNASIEFTSDHYAYYDAAVTPEVVVKAGDTIIPSDNYTISYSNNKSAGIGTISVNSKLNGICTGSTSKEFTIDALTKVDAKSPTCTEDGSTEYYTCSCGKYYLDSNAENEIEEDSWIVQDSALGHIWDDGEVTRPATCTEKGVKTFSCTRDGCNKTRVEEIEALGHDTVHYDAVGATCESSGNREYYYCNNCKKYYSDAECTNEIEENSWIITALGHNWDDGEITRLATCTEEGVKTFTCTRDGCGKTRTEKIAALGHSWNDGEVTRLATCIEKGVKTFTCTRDGCNKTRTEEIEAIGHDTVHYEAVEANCELSGNSEYYYCNNCKKYYSDAKCTNEIEENSWIITALGHNWDNGEITRPATCTEKGVKTFSCTRDGCNKTKTEELDILSHNYETIPFTPATVDADGFYEHKECRDCHQVDSKTVIKQIDASSIKLNETTFIVDGTEHEPEVSTIKDAEENELNPDTDYEISYEDNKYEGIGKAIITFKGNYSGTVTREFAINKTDATGITIELDQTEYTYDGEEKKPGVTVYDADDNEIASSKYEVTYENNVDAGDATVTVSLSEDYYEGQLILVANFTILKAHHTLDVEQTEIKVKAKKTAQINATGDGKIVYSTANKSIATVSSSGLAKGVKAGTTMVTVLIAGDKNHNEARATVNVIVPTVITKAVLTKTSYTYNGEVQKPGIKSVNGSTKLQPDIDYTIEYKDSNNNDCDDPIEAGTYKVVITGIGKCDGTVTQSFTIAKAANTVTTEATATTIYVGKKKAEITASAKEDAGITYSLDKTSKKYVSIVDDGKGKATLTAIKAGTAKVTVTSAATDNYKASSKTISITVKSPVDVSASKVTSVGTAVWNGGEEINPAVTVKSGKTTFKSGTDYKIRYELVNTGEGTDDDWDVGDTVKVTVDATDEDAFACKGTIVKNVVITKATQPATATAPSTIYYGEGKEPVQIDVDNIPSTDGDTNPNVTYKSSSTKIATVSDDGKITPIKAGKVTITVNIGETTHYSAKSIKLTVNVKAATKLTSKNVKITAAYNDGENVVPKVTVTGFKEGTDYTVEYNYTKLYEVQEGEESPQQVAKAIAIDDPIDVTVKAVAASGGCLGTYTATVKVGKGEQSITIDSQPTTVKVKATTPTFKINGVKEAAKVDVTTKTYAKINKLGIDQDGNYQFSITGIKKGTATVTVKIGATNLYNAKTLTFKVKVSK